MSTDYKCKGEKNSQQGGGIEKCYKRGQVGQNFKQGAIAGKTGNLNKDLRLKEGV